MISLAHIINPFDASNHQDLALAQPITFESMRAAKRHAAGKVDISLLSAQFAEDENLVPKGFIATSNLQQSCINESDFPLTRKLPLIAEIIDRAYQESSADYIIFTNVDIGVQAEFYVKVCDFIENGHDAFIINRRRISNRFSSPNQLNEIYQEPGKSHPGFDCFVIKRELIPFFSLAKIVIGVPFIGIAMAQNVFCHAKNPKVFEKEYLTFHIGMEIFRKRAEKIYMDYNREQFRMAMKPLMSMMDSRKWPYGNKSIFERMVRWGLNPSLPIKLALALEPRRWI